MVLTNTKTSTGDDSADDADFVLFLSHSGQIKKTELAGLFEEEDQDEENDEDCENDEWEDILDTETGKGAHNYGFEPGDKTGNM